MQVQLFSRNGELADTVAVAKVAEIVTWKNHYYALRAGRYVECDIVAGVQVIIQMQERSKTIR